MFCGLVLPAAGPDLALLSLTYKPLLPTLHPTHCAVAVFIHLSSLCRLSPLTASAHRNISPGPYPLLVDADMATLLC